VLDQGHWREAEMFLLFAAPFATAGLRLLNPAFTTLAAVAMSFAVTLVAGANYSEWHTGVNVLRGVLCFAVAFLALAAGAFHFKRPSHDRMLDWLVLAMPLAGYLWASSGHVASAPVDYLHDHTLVRLVAPLAPLAFGITAFFVAIRRRTHAPLLAFMICIACVAYELRALSGLSLQTRLIVWGSVTLLVTAALERFLRTPRGGITSQKMSDRKGPSSLLQLAGTAALTPHTHPAESPTFQGAGGHAGGGGASGTY
jgi:uncharacterized membrane protein YgcG